MGLIITIQNINGKFLKGIPENYHKEIKDILALTKKDKIKKGVKFFGRITTTVKVGGKKKRLKGRKSVYIVEAVDDKLIVKDYGTNEVFYTSKNTIFIQQLCDSGVINEVYSHLRKRYKTEEEQKKKEFEVHLERNGFQFKSLQPVAKMQKSIEAGIKNIWLVGPAGCGKSTITRELAETLGVELLCISCGIGTSATTFLGRMYPKAEATRFAEFYAKPSVILIDEFTALDPAVAQILNSALANGEIETTTGVVKRHPDCIIVATSNTFGGGADRQYVANNQLDASTIDRFIGGIIEINYSNSYEEQYDKEVVEYVREIRKLIKDNNLRRIASTRWIQAAHGWKKNLCKDWREMLITNWSDVEKKIVKEAGLLECKTMEETAKMES